MSELGIIILLSCLALIGIPMLLGMAVSFYIMSPLNPHYWRKQNEEPKQPDSE